MIRKHMPIVIYLHSAPNWITDKSLKFSCFRKVSSHLGEIFFKPHKSVRHSIERHIDCKIPFGIVLYSQTPIGSKTPITQIVYSTPLLIILRLSFSWLVSFRSLSNLQLKRTHQAYGRNS